MISRSRISAASCSSSERESFCTCSGESIPSSMLAMISVSLRVLPHLASACVRVASPADPLNREQDEMTEQRRDQPRKQENQVVPQRQVPQPGIQEHY